MSTIPVERLENGDYIHWGRRSRAFGDTMGACLYTGEDARVIDLLLKYEPRRKATSGGARRQEPKRLSVDSHAT